MDTIPQIKPDDSFSSGDVQEERGSILIPKINLEQSGVVGQKKKEVKKPTKRKKGKFRIGKKLKIFGAVLGTIVVLVVVFSFLFWRVYLKVVNVKSSVGKLVVAGQTQDLPQIKNGLQTTKVSIKELKDTYKSLSWLKVTPFIGNYLKDIEHGLEAVSYGLEAGEIVVEIIEPYADIIGFSNGDTGQAESGEETAQDRLDFIVKTIPEVAGKADGLIEKVKLVREEIGYIDTNRYPENFQGTSVRAKLKNGISQIDTFSSLVEKSKPLLEVAPQLLGADEEKTYLVLFQNDKELRPTGGFITAYSIAKVNKGKFEPVASSDIYTLDNLYTPSVPAPEPIKKYLKGPYLLSGNLRLRDSNWSPDFYESMKLFTTEAKSAGIDDIDGVIAVDTELLVNILDALGPIGVPGYGDFSTNIIPECDCPQVVYELESFADIEGPIVWSENEPGKIVFAPPNYDNRKKIIGPLMNSILSNALGQSKEKIPALFQAGFNSLLEKHVLFYMFDEEAQHGVESFGIAGRINEFEGDYLHINDANLGGRKSNLYVTQEVAQEIEVTKDGSVEKTVTISYKNPKEYDGWLNSVLPNWVRIYVPKGAELIEFSGVEDKEKPYEELGKTVFAGFFELRPQGVSKVTVKYKLPFKVEGEYKMFLQKQPGTGSPLYSIQIGKREEEFFLKTDRELNFSL